MEMVAFSFFFSKLIPANKTARVGKVEIIMIMAVVVFLLLFFFVFLLFIVMCKFIAP